MQHDVVGDMEGCWVLAVSGAGRFLNSRCRFDGSGFVSFDAHLNKYQRYVHELV
jgi:hypothetical protein